MVQKRRAVISGSNRPVMVRQRAITEADTRLLREIQNGIKEDFLAYLKKTKN